MYINGNTDQSEMTGSPDKYPQGRFKDKPCRWCGLVFSPQAPSHLFCSQDCVDARFMERYLQKTYSISREDYFDMHQRQQGLCAICGGEGFLMDEHHKLRLVVDHCHETGLVRGLLCHNCNRGLGLFQDSVQNLRAAAEYL